MAYNKETRSEIKIPQTKITGQSERTEVGFPGPTVMSWFLLYFILDLRVPTRHTNLCIKE